MISTIRRGSMKGYLACLSIVRFFYLPTPQTELFCKEMSELFNEMPAILDYFQRQQYKEAKSLLHFL